MGYVIALAGKGGSGKTTIAALLVRLLRDGKKGAILAVDADPNSNLAESLGIKNEACIGSIIDDVAAHPDKIPSGMTKDRFIEYQVQTAVAEGDGFDLLTMGKPEGPGCYCYANNVLRGVMDKLIKDYDYVVIDNEAGLEHLARRTTRRADTLLVVSQPTADGLRAARRIGILARDMDVKTKKQLLLVNFADAGIDARELSGIPLDPSGFIPPDKSIAELSRSGAPLENLPRDSAALTALFRLGDKIWQ